MHLNYYFIKQIASTLDTQLGGSEIVECFSQNKDELILKFINRWANSEFYIRASLDNTFTCLSFPPELHRAKRNSIDLFDPALGKKVLSIHCFENERAFSIELENNTSLVFKMFGNRSNILLYIDGEFKEMFNQKMKPDSRILLPLDKVSTVNYTDFESDPDLIKWFPVLKGIPEDYILSQGYNALPIQQKWNLVRGTIDLLENCNKYYIISHKDKLRLSCLPLHDVLKEADDPLKISNEYYRHVVTTESFLGEQRRALATIKKEISKANNYLRKTQAKLDQLEKGANYRLLGDIIMANMGVIKSHQSSVDLLDFYTNEPVTIKLKPALTPQKNAELYYRKARNQHLEVQNLENNLKARRTKLNRLTETEQRILTTESLKELRKITKSDVSIIYKEKSKTSLPYLEREFQGFKILIGKNARANDKLLNSFTRKDDLWLHVKDAAGSHVIIKQFPGKDYSKDLIEKAAQYAAWYSKRKSESLVPVSYTPRKYVRKRKGDPAGLVVVEREKVVLVEPLV
jgi:hypothetical protein